MFRFVDGSLQSRVCLLVTSRCGQVVTTRLVPLTTKHHICCDTGGGLSHQSRCWMTSFRNKQPILSQQTNFLFRRVCTELHSTAMRNRLDADLTDKLDRRDTPSFRFATTSSTPRNDDAVVVLSSGYIAHRRLRAEALAERQR